MSAKDKTSPESPKAPSVPRALEVLERIAGSASGLTLAQLTRGLGYPRSSVHCLLATLEGEGYIQRSSSRGPYIAGGRLMTLSGKALGGAGLREKALPELRRLMRRTMPARTGRLGDRTDRRVG